MLWNPIRSAAGVMATNRGVKTSARALRADLVRTIALEAHERIRFEGRVADRTLENLLRREARLYAIERRAITDAVYGLLREEPLLIRLLEPGLGAGGFAALSPSVRSGFLYAAREVRSGGSTPEKALGASGLSPGLVTALRGLAREAALLASLPPVDRAILVAGIPDWLAAKLRAQLGDEETTALAIALAGRAPLTIRANVSKAPREAVAAALEATGATTTPTRYSPEGLVVEAKESLFATAAFKNGLFEIQDEGSQLLARCLAARPGERIADACAGAGGKSLALAVELRGKGKILALDNDERRLGELPTRARRAGVHNIERHLVPDEGPSEIETKLAGTCEGVLIDAPCSGTGVLRRNPDGRYRLKPEEIERFSALQAKLLVRYAALAKPGGRIVYATCSLLREENEEVVDRVLAATPWLTRGELATGLGPAVAAELHAGATMRLFPHKHGTDGFFAAALRRI